MVWQVAGPGSGSCANSLAADPRRAGLRAQQEFAVRVRIAQLVATDLGESGWVTRGRADRPPWAVERESQAAIGFPWRCQQRGGEAVAWFGTVRLGGIAARAGREHRPTHLDQAVPVFALCTGRAERPAVRVQPERGGGPELCSDTR
ncbi:hypothetical protein D3C78_892210 [compost metagenome]